MRKFATIGGHCKRHGEWDNKVVDVISCPGCRRREAIHMRIVTAVLVLVWVAMMGIALWRGLR